MKISMENRKRHPVFDVLKAISRLLYPRYVIIGLENVLKDSPVVFICNHLGANGPIVMVLFSPFKFKPWVLHNVMSRKLCRDYLEKDFTRKELKLPPPFSGWFASILAPLCIRVMKSVEAIPVYKGKINITDTFNMSVEAISQGYNLVIFPEKEDVKFSEVVNDFHTGFIHLARQYNEETGNTLQFYPVYINKEKRTIAIGKPITYSSERDFNTEKVHIAVYLRDSICEIASKGQIM